MLKLIYESDPISNDECLKIGRTIINEDIFNSLF